MFLRTVGPAVGVVTSAYQVFGPTMPSISKPFACWKRRTAKAVCGPKSPSTASDAVRALSCR
jgi:hypothetical protein